MLKPARIWISRTKTSSTNSHAGNGCNNQQLDENGMTIRRGRRENIYKLGKRPENQEATLCPRRKVGGHALSKLKLQVFVFDHGLRAKVL